MSRNATIPYMIHNCIRCRAKLIPIVYDRVDPEYISLMAKNKILISLDKDRTFNSFCPLCEERYGDFTDLPSDFPDDQNIQNITFPQ